MNFHQIVEYHTFRSKVRLFCKLVPQERRLLKHKADFFRNSGFPLLTTPFEILNNLEFQAVLIGNSRIEKRVFNIVSFCDQGKNSELKPQKPSLRQFYYANKYVLEHLLSSGRETPATASILLFFQTRPIKVFATI